MPMHWRYIAGLAAGLCLAAGVTQAQQGAVLRPVPTAECQQLAMQVQQAAGFAVKSSEEDFFDVSDEAEGRSCHITGEASSQKFADSAALMAPIAKLFGDWRDDPARTADGPAGTEKGFTKGARIVTVEVDWEPGPGVTCSDKQPLSACKISPEQKRWTVTIDAVERLTK